jgi:hypothetical protein
VGTGGSVVGLTVFCVLRRKTSFVTQFCLTCEGPDFWYCEECCGLDVTPYIVEDKCRFLSGTCSPHLEGKNGCKGFSRNIGIYETTRRRNLKTVIFL